MNRSVITAVVVGIATFVLMIVVMSVAIGTPLLAVGPAVAVAVGVGMAAFFALRPSSQE